VTFQYKGGIADFVRHLNATKSPMHKSVVEFGADTEGMSVEVAMQWNESYGESVYTFANTINTHEGGTHEEGFRAALTSTVNRYGAERKLLKGDDRLTGEDIREGLAAIISVKLANPQFEGQTKTKLGNTEDEELRADRVQRVAGRLVRAQPGRGEGRDHQGLGGGSGPQSGGSGPQAGAAQVAAGVRFDAGQAGGLPVHRSPGE
jgi:Type IIA topoisomerase (DNA gyrase/topo II, topoisomerase IV), B subunit